LRGIKRVNPALSSGQMEINWNSGFGLQKTLIYILYKTRK